MKRVLYKLFRECLMQFSTICINIKKQVNKNTYVVLILLLFLYSCTMTNKNNEIDESLEEKANEALYLNVETVDKDDRVEFENISN